MDGYVTKPFTIAIIAKCLAEWAGPSVIASASPAAAAPTDPAPEPVLDRAVIAGLAELGNGQAVLRKVLRLFLAHAPEAVAAIRRTVATAEPVALADAVHGLKSMCANIGAKRTAAACHALETLARTGGSWTADHIERIGCEVDAAIAELRSLPEASEPTAAKGHRID